MPPATSGLPLMPQEPRLGRPVDVGVENADLEADRLKPEREIDGDSGLADAALAGGHRNQMLYPGDTLSLAHRGGGGGRRRAPRALVSRSLIATRLGHTRMLAGVSRRFAFGGQHRHRARDPGQLLDDLLGCLAHRLEIVGAGGRHGDREIDPRVLDHDVRDEAEIDDVAVEIGAFHAAQPIENLALRDRHCTLHGEKPQGRTPGCRNATIVSDDALEVTASSRI